MGAKAKRFYSLRSAWFAVRGPAVALEGSYVVLSSSASFEFVENWYKKKLPSSAQLYSEKPWKNIPDLLGEDAPIASTKFKSVVEAMAPGAAEFRPLSLRWQDGSAVSGEWHLFNVRKRIDCIDFDVMGREQPRREEKEAQMLAERTDRMTEEEYWYREGLSNESFLTPIHVNAEAIGDAQIWRPRWKPRLIFITDGMLKAFKKAGVSGLHIERLGTREEPLPGFPAARERSVQ